MNDMNIKKNDTVYILSGKDKGKQGKVIEADPKGGKVLIEGVNIVQRHTKPRKQGEAGGIIKKESPIRACKVMRVCPKCGKPARFAHKTLNDGETVYKCKKCGETI